jgi:hypothetical protein
MSGIQRKVLQVIIKGISGMPGNIIKRFSDFRSKKARGKFFTINYFLKLNKTSGDFCPEANSIYIFRQVPA